MVKKTTALFLAAGLLLGACGQKETGQEQPSSGEPSQAASGINKPTGQEKAPVGDTGKEKTGSSGSQAGDGGTGSKTSGVNAGQSGKLDKPSVSQDNRKDGQKTAAEPQYHMNKVYNIVPNHNGIEEKVVLLTFDDGPKDKEMINGLIDTLDKHKAKAIFFVNGYRVKQNPDLLKLIHDRGQLIGNHSWDHIDLRQQSPAKARKQIEDVQKIVMDTIGEKPKFFRPPFGSGGDAVKKIAKDNDLLFMTWSNGSLDWERKSRNKPEAVINNVMEQLHPGSNILMHELPWTVDALDKLLTKMEKKGYRFVDPRNIEPSMR